MLYGVTCCLNLLCLFGIAFVAMVGTIVGERIGGLKWEAFNSVLPEIGDGMGVTWCAAMK